MPQLPAHLAVSSSKQRRESLAKLLGAKKGETADDVLAARAKMGVQGSIESAVAEAVVSEHSTRGLRRRGAVLPEPLASRAKHLVEDLGIPEDLARIVAINSPVNSFERTIIEQVEQFEQSVEENGSQEAALLAGGVPAEAVAAMRRAKQLEDGEIAVDGQQEEDGRPAEWAREQTLARARVEVEEKMGASMSAVQAAREEMDRLQAAGLTLDQAASVVFKDPEDGSKDGTGSETADLDEEGNTATKPRRERLTPVKARVFLAQTPNLSPTEDAIQEALNRKLVRVMLDRLSQVSVVEPSQVDLSRETVQRKLVTRSAMRTALMETCAEFEGAVSEQPSDSEEGARARKVLEEFRMRIRQLKREIDTFGDTDGHGRPVGNPAKHGRSAPKTKGRNLPLQFDREDEVRKAAPDGRDSSKSPDGSSA